MMKSHEPILIMVSLRSIYLHFANSSQISFVLDMPGCLRVHFHEENFERFNFKDKIMTCAKDKFIFFMKMHHDYLSNTFKWQFKFKAVAKYIEFSEVHCSCSDYDIDRYFVQSF